MRIPESRREADRSAATKTFQRIQDSVATDVPVLPIWQGKQIAAVRDGITGVDQTFDPSFQFRYWLIEKS